MQVKVFEAFSTMGIELFTNEFLATLPSYIDIQDIKLSTYLNEDGDQVFVVLILYGKCP